jgi:hypothetical protein
VGLEESKKTVKKCAALLLSTQIPHAIAAMRGSKKDVLQTVIRQ